MIHGFITAQQAHRCACAGIRHSPPSDAPASTSRYRETPRSLREVGTSSTQHTHPRRIGICPSLPRDTSAPLSLPPGDAPPPPPRRPPRSRTHTPWSPTTPAPTLNPSARRPEFQNPNATLHDTTPAPTAQRTGASDPNATLGVAWLFVCAFGGLGGTYRATRHHFITLRRQSGRPRPVPGSSGGM